MNGIVRRKDNIQTFESLWQPLSVTAKAGPHSTVTGLRYAFALAEERGLEDDRSFIFVKDGQPVAGAVLPIGVAAGVRAVTMGGGYVYAPLVADNAFRKEVFKLVDVEIRSVGVAKSMLMLDPLDSVSYNYLQEYGYLDTSTLTYVYDLTISGDPMNHCRRNHARNLKKILSNPHFRTVRIDANSPDRAHHENYERLHERAAGRKTRSSRTFDLMYEQLLAGEAVLFAVLMEDVPVAYGYFWQANEKAFYASVADDPDAAGQPLNHLLTFSGMRYFKERGFAALVPGEPSSPSPQFDYFPDAKQLHISLFKSGFPGSYRPFYRGIRYYDKSAIARDAMRFGEEYPQALSIFETEPEI